MRFSMGRLEENGNGRALVHFAFQLDLGVVDAGDVFDDGQPQPGAAGGLAPALIHPVEAFKYAGLRFLGDADAVVLDGQSAVTIPAAGGDDLDFSTRAIVPDGIVAEVLAQFVQQASATRSMWRPPG